MKIKYLSRPFLLACVLAAFVLQPLPSQADHGFAWSELALVLQVMVTPNGVAYVQLDPAVVTNQHGCALFGGWFVMVRTPPFSESAFKEMLAGVYAAKASLRAMQFGGFGCFDNTYPLASYALFAE